ncbi:hypothetical protein GmHk_20G059001 [Glycine max]|nr:hypothetical protein GmHk_20G059001 [Glycine max]
MLRKVESMKFAQLIKNRYLLQTDKCFKFFHALIKRNRHSQFIAAIRLEDGITLPPKMKLLLLL